MRALLPPLALAACATFPEVDAAIPPAARNAPFPSLLPTAAFDAAPAERLSPEAGQALEGRQSDLEARAARLRDPVLTEAERARLGR
ncbi:hypothetical protein BCF33_0435 [Hasllibacter halocynthiae]|uniref:Uncharacterized protein n=1 Tax=Hasllibacter halocynthiae TaxID=595589 RepID=A0A2T0X7D1_9RHOB|nr:hypothetical protein [Hasllibacter halocynthiae]PRY94833.1 hypothetical protein BCF33_0435 [Hasllibacter halocynthiae]